MLPPQIHLTIFRLLLIAYLDLQSSKFKVQTKLAWMATFGTLIDLMWQHFETLSMTYTN
jgi:hypothetical protein